MERIKLEITDMNEEEPCEVKDEDTEEQSGWCAFMFLIFTYDEY